MPVRASRSRTGGETARAEQRHHVGRKGGGGGHGHAGEDAGAGDVGGVQGAGPLRRPRLPEHRGSHQEGNNLTLPSSSLLTQLDWIIGVIIGWVAVGV